VESSVATGLSDRSNYKEKLEGTDEMGFYMKPVWMAVYKSGFTQGFT
jgi:hypothetical protein